MDIMLYDACNVTVSTLSYINVCPSSPDRLGTRKTFVVMYIQKVRISFLCVTAIIDNYILCHSDYSCEIDLSDTDKSNESHSFNSNIILYDACNTYSFDLMVISIIRRKLSTRLNF